MCTGDAFISGLGKSLPAVSAVAGKSIRTNRSHRRAGLRPDSQSGVSTISSLPWNNRDKTGNSVTREALRTASQAGQNRVTYPGFELSQNLSVVARLIKGDLGSRVNVVSLGGFDLSGTFELR